MGTVAELGTRRVGTLEVTPIGLGCNNLGARLSPDQAQRVIDAALDSGVNLFDTADSYGAGRSEELLGHTLGRRRGDVLIATKFGNPHGDVKGGAAPTYIRQAVAASLRRLGTDYIDLYQLHSPDPATPIEDTVAVLVDLRAQGVIREFGVSNFAGPALRAAQRAAEKLGAHVGTVQNKLNLLELDDEGDGLAAAAELGIGYLPWWPLATGMLTGKFLRGRPPLTGTRAATFDQERLDAFFAERNFDVVEQLGSWASERGHTVLELAIAWLASHSAVVSVIAGASTPEQLHANVAAAKWTLSSDEMAEVRSIALGASDDKRLHGEVEK